MKHKIIVALLLITGMLQAQDKKETFSFTLKEAIDHAVQHNYSVINADRDVAAAKEKKWETTTMGLPQITGDVNYLNNFVFTQQGISGNAFNPAGDPDGVTTIAFGTKNSMTAGATLRQLLFDGSYLVGLQSAKTYLKISENAKVKTSQEVKEIVVNSYGNVLLADESILILQKNQGILNKTLSDTRETFKNGLIEEENVEQLQITLSSLDSSLENVKRQRTIALNMLKLVLGIDLDSDLELKDKLESLTQNNIDLELLTTEFNVANNIDYQIGENMLTSKQLLLKYEKSKALPTLSAVLNFGYNAFSNEFSFFNGDQKWNNFSNLGVNLSIPIFSSGARSSRTQQAKIAMEQSQTQLTETGQKLRLEFQKAKSDYDYSLAQLATSKSNLKLAERIENKNQTKFREGLSSSFDLTEAQRQLYTSQQNYLQAMLDVINKRATLEKLLNKN